MWGEYQFHSLMTSRNKQTLPPKLHFSGKERQFVRETLADLVETGCIVKLRKPIRNGWHSNIFLRPKCNGSFRMILNLKPLNKFIKYQKLKMPNIYTVMAMIKPHDRLISVDLSNAYSSLKIRDAHCKYLQFSFEGNHYMYLALPNGIAIGPQVFVEMTKAITCFLWKRGVNMIIYIDDTLLIYHCAATLSRYKQFALDTFQKWGFVINFEKSQLTPSTRAEFLGFEFDTVRFTITLTAGKTASALKLVKELLKAWGKCKIRSVAKVIGTLDTIFPYCEDSPLYYRSLEWDKIRTLHDKGSWNGKILVSHSGREELLWWQKVLSKGPPPKILKTKIIHLTFLFRCDLGWLGGQSWAVWTWMVPSLQYKTLCLLILRIY